MFNRNAFYLLLCCKNLPVPQIENSVNNIALSHFIQWHRDVFSVLFGSCCCCYLSRIFCIRWLHFNRNKPPLWRFFSLWSLKSMEYAVRVDLAFNWIPVIGAQTVHFVGNQTNCTSLSLSPSQCFFFRRWTFFARCRNSSNGYIISSMTLFVHSEYLFNNWTISTFIYRARANSVRV